MGTPMRASTSDAMANGLTELGLATAGAGAAAGAGAGSEKGAGVGAVKGAGAGAGAGAGGGGRYLSEVAGGVIGSLWTVGTEAVGGELATSRLANG